MVSADKLTKIFGIINELYKIFFKKNLIKFFSVCFPLFIRRKALFSFLKTETRLLYKMPKQQVRNVISVVSPDDLRSISVPAPYQLRIISG